MNDEKQKKRETTAKLIIKRREAKDKAAKYLSKCKKSHKWLQEGSFDHISQTYRPMAGCCKICGIHYQLFKHSPMM